MRKNRFSHPYLMPPQNNSWLILFALFLYQKMLEQWYWMIPNTVLYNNELSDKQKLLFCAISNLCAEKWYCRATNEYIWELLNADKRTISRNLSTLQEKWFISIEDDIQRKITLDKNVVGGRQKCLGGIDKNVYHNNTI